MILETLLLKNFKNYTGCSLSFNPRLNLFIGNNGNGKTNLLEAVSLLCYTKSFLQNSESDCVRYGERSFELQGGFMTGPLIKHRIYLLYDSPAGKKIFEYNRERVTKLAEIFGRIPLVVLSPRDIRLTSGPPSERRQNFDLLLSQSSILYLENIRKYSRIIKQKNVLLRDNITRKPYQFGKLKEMIEMWNEKIIDVASDLLKKRLEFINEFNLYMSENFNDLVGSSYLPIIEYESEVLSGIDRTKPDTGTIRKNIKSRLSEKFPVEITRGLSIVGPHRDNYNLKMEKGGEIFDLRTFASRGEHKTFIVALKFSEFSFLKHKLESSNSGDPILLLDDMFSELDRSRIERIASVLPKFGQVFITSTEENIRPMLGRYFTNEDISSYEVENGKAVLIN